MWEPINLKDIEEARYINSCGLAVRMRGESFVVDSDHLQFAKDVIVNYRETEERERSRKQRKSR